MFVKVPVRSSHRRYAVRQEDRRAPERLVGAKTVRSFAARRDRPGLACDLADLVHNLVKGLFDPYRPELHYMRGPGPKWRAKHERALRIDPDVLALTPARLHHAHIYAPEERAIRGHDRALVLRLAVFVITLLINAVTVSETDASYCGQGSDFAAARLQVVVEHVRVTVGADRPVSRG